MSIYVSASVDNKYTRTTLERKQKRTQAFSELKMLVATINMISSHRPFVYGLYLNI